MRLKLALELLTGCGMIRRSEKRSLIGVEALGIRTIVLDPFRRAAAEVPRHTNRFLQRVLGTVTVYASGNSVIPLVNPF